MEFQRLWPGNDVADGEKRAREGRGRSCGGGRAEWHVDVTPNSQPQSLPAPPIDGVFLPRQPQSSHRSAIFGRGVGSISQSAATLLSIAVLVFPSRPRLVRSLAIIRAWAGFAPRRPADVYLQFSRTVLRYLCSCRSSRPYEDAQKFASSYDGHGEHAAVTYRTSIAFR